MVHSRNYAPAWIALALVSCGGSEASGDAGGQPRSEDASSIVDSAADSATDGATEATVSTDAALSESGQAPYACGAFSCAASQTCIQPCPCGGAAGPCNPPGDAGCPVGTTLSKGCCATCVDPPPTCVDVVPVDCIGSVSSRFVTCVCRGA
jgi:hypothetical protein